MWWELYIQNLQKKTTNNITIANNTTTQTNTAPVENSTKNEVEENTTQTNEVPANTTNNSVSNKVEANESQEKEVVKSDKDKAIQMVKEKYGDNSSDYVYDYYVNNQGKSIVSMSAKSNGNNYYFEVDINKGTVEEY